MEDFSLSRLILQVVGYAVGAVSFLFVLSAVEPFRERRKAWLEFGKWLDVLPVQLRFMLKLSQNGLKSCKSEIEQQIITRYIVNAPVDVEGSNFEIEELQEIREGLVIPCDYGVLSQRIGIVTMVVVLLGRFRKTARCGWNNGVVD